MSRELIVLVAPKIHDPLYKDQFSEIINFQIGFANLILGKNNVIVLADNDTIPFLTGGYPDKIPSENILEANIADIWIRDFGLVNQVNPVKLGYTPQYLEAPFAELSQTTFLNFLNQSGIEIVETDSGAKRANLSASSTSLEYYPEINIEGGNIVYDFNGNAILTDRFFPDNKQFKDSKSAEKTLSEVLGFFNVVIISQPGDNKEDTTGHADETVSFIDDNVIAYSGHLNDSKRAKLVSELKSGFGDSFRLVELPSYHYWEIDPTITFTSAVGIHANALVTKNYIYMPTFGHDPISQSKGYTVENDEKVFEIMQNNTKKQVIKVPVPYKVGILGGSVRCLSMQIEGPIAEKLISLAANTE